MDRTVWMRFPCAHLLLYVRSGMANLLPMRSHRNSLDMRDVRGALTGGTPAENAEITKAILKGEEKGPKRQAVCLNAGAALYIAGKAASIEEGVKLAESLIDSGAALKKLEEFVEETNK